MKRKIIAFLSLFIALVLIFPLGASFARYKSDVTLEKSIDYARTAGSIYKHVHADIGGYLASSDSFSFAAGSPRHVHYRISNMSESGQEDQRNTEYYIRVVAESDDAKKVFKDKTDYNNSWGICPLWTWDPISASNPYPKTNVGGVVGYGPFTWDGDKNAFVTTDGRELVSGSYLDVVVEHGSGDDVAGLTGAVTLKVQLFTERGTTIKVIDEIALRIQITNETGAANLLFTYWSYGTNAPITAEDGTQITQSFSQVPFGTHFDFGDPDNLTARGIVLPEGYFFVTAGNISYVSSAAWDWTPKTSFDVNNRMNEGTPIQVFLVRDDSVVVQFQYWDRSKPEEKIGSDGKPYTAFEKIGDDSPILQIKKGSVIDFNDPSTLTAAGITMPDSYKYVVSHCNVERWWHDAQHWFQDRYNVPSDPAVVIAVLDVYLAPIEMRSNIEVVIENTSGIIATVKMTENASGLMQFTYNGMTYMFNADGKITFDYSSVKTMFGNSIYNSFAVYIRNGASSITVDAMKNSGSVTVDYFNVYQGVTTSSTGYCLANPNMQLVIKTWGYDP